ncbi:MAG: putative quinol monooxygenase, partial [Cetobacterium sp.]
MIRVVVPILVKEGMKEEFLKIAQPLIEASREEKGCIEYFLLDSGVE